MAKKKQNNTMYILIALAAIFLFSNGFNTGFQAVIGGESVVRTLWVGANQITDGNVYSGDAVDVKLTIDPSTSTQAMLVHEVAPTNIVGLSSNIYEFALIDEIQVQPQTKSYQILPSSGSHAFIGGVYTVNGGADQNILGVNSFQVISCTSTSEACNNVDDDCDYLVDEGISFACYTGPAGTQGQGVCVGGTRTCSAGALSGCVGEVLPSLEICGNGVDEDCNGADLSSNTVADIDCDSIVNWQEINFAVDKWLIGMYDWTTINQVIVAWLS